MAGAEAGGPLRILDLDGAERATRTVPDGHVLAVAHERASGTWRALTRVDRRDDVHHGLIRLSDDARVLEQRPLDAVTDGAWLRDGAVLVYGNERGVLVLDDPDDTARQLAPAGTGGQRPH